MHNISISIHTLKDLIFNEIPTYIREIDKRIFILVGVVFAGMSLYTYTNGLKEKQISSRSKTSNSSGTSDETLKKTPSSSSITTTQSSPPKSASKSQSHHSQVNGSVHSELNTDEEENLPIDKNIHENLTSQQLTELNNLYSSASSSAEQFENDPEVSKEHDPIADDFSFQSENNKKSEESGNSLSAQHSTVENESLDSSFVDNPKESLKTAWLNFQKHFPFTVTKEANNKIKCYYQDLIDLQDQLVDVVEGNLKTITVSQNSLYGQVVLATIPYAQIYNTVANNHLFYQTAIDNLHHDFEKDFIILDTLENEGGSRPSCISTEKKKKQASGSRPPRISVGKTEKKEGLQKLSLRLKQKERDHIDFLRNKENIESCLKCPIEHYRSFSLIISDQLGEVMGAEKPKKGKILGIVKELLNTEETQLQKLRSIVKLSNNKYFLQRILANHVKAKAIIDAGIYVEKIVPHQENIVKELEKFYVLAESSPELFAQAFKDVFVTEDE